MAGFPDAQGVVNFIRRYGVQGLGGSDGCLCANFHLLGWFVDVSCHKSEHTVRVYSHCLGETIADGFPIAAEVCRWLILQIDAEGAARYNVRFCEYSNDNGRWDKKVWVKEQACCYCGALGRDEAAYLCSKCAADPNVARQYDDSGWPLVDPRASLRSEILQ